MQKLEFLSKNLIAHRGIHNDKIIENTLGAFKRAINKKYPIELDIHLLKDKNIIVYHDDNLKRLNNINKYLKELTLPEINKITKFHIPTLQEVLDLVNGRVPIIIEYKFDNKVGLLEKESTKLLDNYKGLFTIQSFNPLTILWFKLNRPNYIRGQLVHSIFHQNILINYILKTMFTNIITKPHYIACNLNMLDNKIIKTRKEKYLILGYTIKKKSELFKYKDYANNFICDISSMEKSSKLY